MNRDQLAKINEGLRVIIPIVDSMPLRNFIEVAEALPGDKALLRLAKALMVFQAEVDRQISEVRDAPNQPD